MYIVCFWLCSRRSGCANQATFRDICKKQFTSNTTLLANAVSIVPVLKMEWVSSFLKLQIRYCASACLYAGMRPAQSNGCVPFLTYSNKAMPRAIMDSEPILLNSCFAPSSSDLIEFHPSQPYPEFLGVGISPSCFRTRGIWSSMEGPSRESSIHTTL
jgi:hypothetical protein